MKIKRLVKYYLLGKSLKEIEMDRILEKISKKLTLTKKESDFLNLYNRRSNSDQDYMMLSKNMTYEKIKDLLGKNRSVICDLNDRDGKIGLPIIDIKNSIDDEKCLIVMKDNITHNLHDKYLYNLIFNIKRDNYSLQEHDEYFEKIEASNDN
jgi:hypothetical protein